MIPEAARTTPVAISKVAVEPFECIRAGWSLVMSGDRFIHAAGLIGLFCVAMFVGSFVPFGTVILMGPAMCGMFYVIFKWVREEQSGAGDMIKGFEWLGEAIGVTLIAMLIQGVIMFFLLGGLGALVFLTLVPSIQSGTEPSFGLIAVLIGGGYLTLLFIGTLARLLFAFAYPLVVDRGCGPIDAITWSVKGAIPHLPGLFALSVLNAIITTIGILLCFIPGLLYVPVATASMAFAYIKIYGLSEEPSFRTFESGTASLLGKPAGGRGEWRPMDPDAAGSGMVETVRQEPEQAPEPKPLDPAAADETDGVFGAGFEDAVAEQGAPIEDVAGSVDDARPDDSDAFESAATAEVDALKKPEMPPAPAFDYEASAQEANEEIDKAVDPEAFGALATRLMGAHTPEAQPPPGRTAPEAEPESESESTSESESESESENENENENEGEGEGENDNDEAAGGDEA